MKKDFQEWKTIEKLYGKLIDEFFIKWIPKDGKILDIGCGYGEFINQVNCRKLARI